jgi:hypothetical protein
MKILFDFKDMTGGAPRSHLSHMLLLKRAGYDVVATIGQDYEKLQTLSEGIRIIPIINFNGLNFWSLINNIYTWQKLLAIEVPEIIYSNRIPQFRFLAVVSDFSGIPLVFAQAGGIAKVNTLLPMKGKVPVCYSLENKKVFVAAGFSERKVHVISNRISQSASHKGKAELQQKTDCLKILMVGNIRDVTINGYLHFLSLLLKNAAIVKNTFNLKIGGKDISPEGTYKIELSEKIIALNNSLKGIGIIEHPSWIENIQSVQAKSNVIIGKGRSVIEPAMQGKVCFVLAETGRLTKISPATFQSLYEYNFSGRGNQKDNTDDFLQILKKGVSSELLNEAEQAAQLVKDAYLLDYAKEKIEEALSDALRIKKKNKFKRCFCGVTRFVLIFLLIVKNKLQKLLSN